MKRAMGTWITNLREGANMSQEELADLMGVSRQTIYRWENGRGEPSHDKLLRLAECLGVPVESLSEETSAQQVCADAQTSEPKEELAQGENTGVSIKPVVFWVLLTLGSLIAIGVFLLVLSIGIFVNGGDDCNSIGVWYLSRAGNIALGILGILAVIVTDIVLIVRFLRKKRKCNTDVT